jgi:hypothetical protein
MNLSLKNKKLWFLATGCKEKRETAFCCLGRSYQDYRPSPAVYGFI